jgi:hypothetical protein
VYALLDLSPDNSGKLTGKERMGATLHSPAENAGTSLRDLAFPQLNTARKTVMNKTPDMNFHLPRSRDLPKRFPKLFISHPAQIQSSRLGSFMKKLGRAGKVVT